MIDEVVTFSNGIVLVFDEKGKQMPKYQGRYEEVKGKILAHAPRSAKFFHADRYRIGNGIARKGW